MPRTLLLLCTLLICGLGSQLSIRSASARTTLTNAIVELIRNEVELRPQGESARPAAIEDEMFPGDALATARESFAELSFNDGSLARLGESVLFRFVPNTRTFRLDNGTVLLLIPPGRGRTNLRTPNATAGIRGSALFVRYIEATNTTLVGALTDSGIQVYNEDETERYELSPGEMAVVVDDRIQRVYQFDLDRFYETSQLTAGLGLQSTDYYANRGQIETTPEPEGLTLVRAETLTALENYEFDESRGDVAETPAFMRMTATTNDLRDAGLQDDSSSQPSVTNRTDEQFEDVLDTTEIQNDFTDAPFSEDLDRPSPSVDRRPDSGGRRPNPGNDSGRGDRNPSSPGQPSRPDNRPTPDTDDRQSPDPDDRQPPDNRQPQPNEPEPRDQNRPDDDARDIEDRDDDDRGGRGPQDVDDIDVEAGEG
ncbi:MAG: FecR family protein [Cyanobacteria bacterium J06626_14]